MRIAQVAPLEERVPPALYGGTERVVSTLTEALVRKGHEVTLFASGDSLSDARLIPCCPQALRLDSRSRNSIFHHVYMLERVLQLADQFDIIHFHLDHFHFPMARRLTTPCLTTFHNRLDRQDMNRFALEFFDLPVVAISESHRRQRPLLNWAGVVHHGMDSDVLPMGDGSGGYLAVLGRMSLEKGVDTAIQVAIDSGIDVKIAAKVGIEDEEYFHSVLEPLLDHPRVQYLGEIGQEEKGEFLGQAMAMLFPIRWPEPFGLVMIESLACGTPVVAYGQGSVPEVLEHGRTGYIVDTEEEMVRAVERIKAGAIDRKRCRTAFEHRFSASRMADDYLRIYWKLINRQRRTGRREWKRSSRLPANTTSLPPLH